MITRSTCPGSSTSQTNAVPEAAASTLYDPSGRGRTHTSEEDEALLTARACSMVGAAPPSTRASTPPPCTPSCQGPPGVARRIVKREKKRPLVVTMPPRR
eukprot:4535549-Prymnesium_polylepis.2